LASIEAWVKAGAPWPAGAAAMAAPTAGNKKFWAYVPPKAPALPKVKNSAWAANPLDRFILAQLEAKGLTPAPPANRRTLIRRVTFDLTGLPPTPQEVHDFLADTKPGAFSRVVDRLLASAAYGERWGRHWLDVARYADSNGVDENLVYTQAWRYRDYVIRALNQDKPIDRFIQEQIAGDLLSPLPNDPDDYDRIIATGYLSLGPKMLAEDDPVKQELDVIDEQVDTLGKTFLGLTIGCARCHDHKFDPISTADYYSMASIFKSTKTMLNYQNMAEWQEIPLASKADRDKLEQISGEITKVRKERNGLVEQRSAEILAEARKRTIDYRRATDEFLASAAEQGNLAAAISTPNGMTPPGARIIEAEDFIRGNVLKDKGGFGKDIGVLVNAGTYPNQTEYEFEITNAGAYQIDLRYASGDSRAIRLYVNGKLVSSNAAGKVTGGFFPDQQKWFAEGVFDFAQGKNTIRFERDSYFPHIDKLLILPRPGAASNRTVEAIAQEKNLNVELLSVLVDKRRKQKSDDPNEIELPEKAERVLKPTDREQVARLDASIAKLEKTRPILPKTMAVSEGKPTDLKVHVRGNYLTLGAQCSRRFPEVLASAGQPAIATNSSGRLELARWMTQPNHPLTSRVFVNRVWRWLFGKGIVASVDNFGTLGDRPVNQPLLDWLATTFVSDGWSLKKLHRRILLSNTYQMSSSYNEKAATKDPENRLQWRADRRRLEAEEIRDAILDVSGKLDRTQGGSMLTFKDRQYVTSTANSDPVNYNSNRRSVYLPIIRSALFDVYTAFDFGDPTVMNGDRSSTTVAPQSLFMMNSQVVLESTKAMAEALLAKKELNDRQRISLAYETCYGREVTPAEANRALEVLAKLEKAYETAEPNAEARRLRCWQSVCKTLIASTEFIYLD
jgi:hypothetical protein